MEDGNTVGDEMDRAYQELAEAVQRRARGLGLLPEGFEVRPSKPEVGVCCLFLVGPGRVPFGGAFLGQGMEEAIRALEETGAGKMWAEYQALCRKKARRR